MSTVVTIIPLSYSSETASNFATISLRAWRVALGAINARSRRYDPSGYQEAIILAVGTTLAFSPEIIQFLRNVRRRED